MLKINKYSDACAHWGQKFYPLSFDSFGGMGKKSHKALSAIIAKAATSHPISVTAPKKEFLPDLSYLIARCYCSSSRLRMELNEVC